MTKVSRESERYDDEKFNNNIKILSLAGELCFLDGVDYVGLCCPERL